MEVIILSPSMNKHYFFIVVVFICKEFSGGLSISRYWHNRSAKASMYIHSVLSVLGFEEDIYFDLFWIFWQWICL